MRENQLGGESIFKKGGGKGGRKVPRLNLDIKNMMDFQDDDSGFGGPISNKNGYQKERRLSNLKKSIKKQKLETLKKFETKKTAKKLFDLITPRQESLTVINELIDKDIRNQEILLMQKLRMRQKQIQSSRSFKTDNSYFSVRTRDQTQFPCSPTSKMNRINHIKSRMRRDSLVVANSVNDSFGMEEDSNASFWLK